MIYLRFVLFSVLLFCCSIIASGQDTIYLANPSFEDSPRRGGEFSSPIKGWYDCGLTRFPSESPPDIHPVPGGTAWNVTKKAIDGTTYLGMVVRDNDSWESITQKLKDELTAEQCYSFHAYLSMSPTYQSRTRTSPDNLVNFSNPIVLIIWGGTEMCEKSEFLAKSSPIDHVEWKEYEFEFWPKSDYEYITLEAFYVTPVSKSYNGHILVDGLSPIVKISCD